MVVTLSSKALELMRRRRISPEAAQQFKDIQAKASNAQANPKAFLNSLSSSNTVPISPSVGDLAAHPTTDPSLRFRNLVLSDANSDPIFAKKMAEQFAYDDSYELHGPLVDISHDPIRYSATGEVVTDENLAEFKAEAAKVTTGRIALYQAEKAKRTPDVQILEKLFAYVDGQSDNYLSKLNWTRASQQNAVEYVG